MYNKYSNVLLFRGTRWTWAVVWEKTGRDGRTTIDGQNVQVFDVVGLVATNSDRLVRASKRIDKRIEGGALRFIAQQHFQYDYSLNETVRENTSANVITYVYVHM